MQIKEDFGKQPPVERIVGLELYFDEEPGIVAVLGRGEDAVEPESGLFDLFGTELIAVGATQSSQLKKNRPFGLGSRAGIC